MADLLRQVPIEYELARVNRFELIFPTDLGFESWMLHSCTRPKLTINKIEIPFINGFNYVAGQSKWEQIDIEMIQTIGPSTSQKLMEWVRLEFESLSGRMGYAKGYMKDLVLHSLDPTGVAIEEWILQQSMLVTADFGNNDMSDDKVQMVKFTIQPWRCIQTY